MNLDVGVRGKRHDPCVCLFCTLENLCHPTLGSPMRFMHACNDGTEIGPTDSILRLDVPSGAPLPYLCNDVFDVTFGPFASPGIGVMALCDDMKMALCQHLEGMDRSTRLCLFQGYLEC